MTLPLNRKNYPASYLPERVVQFGEGHFLRAFADWVIQRMNTELHFDTGVVVVQPREKNKIKVLNAQDGLYTVRLTGIVDGKAVAQHEIITCVNRCIHPYEDYDAFLALAHNPDFQFVISNTTEAGIVFVPEDQYTDKPPSSFPGKLTRLLHERFLHFDGDESKGIILMPCELLDRNGDALKKIVLQLADLWKLDPAFMEWLSTCCIFCNSLVDRIVPGYPEKHLEEIRKATGFDDQLVVEGEQFHLWVIESDPRVEKAFPASKAGLSVVLTNDLERYRKRKVRVLNGAHTAMVPLGLLSGLQTVDQCMADPVIGKFIREMILEEVLPTLEGSPEELKKYARDIFLRFENPALEHQLSAIALNSVSKFNTRLLPTLIDYKQKEGHFPPRMIIAWAALLRFYRGDFGNETLPINDDPEITKTIQNHWKGVNSEKIFLKKMTAVLLEDKSLWNQEVSGFDDLSDLLSSALKNIISAFPQKDLKMLLTTFGQ